MYRRTKPNARCPGASRYPKSIALRSIPGDGSLWIGGAPGRSPSLISLQNHYQRPARSELAMMQRRRGLGCVEFIGLLDWWR